MSNISIKATGRDLKFTETGDLSVDEDGDLEVVYGTYLIEEALLRRLYTPPKGYVRQIYDVERDEIVEIGSSYLNNTYRYLSTNSAKVGKAIIEALNQIGKEEDRINYIGTKIESSLKVGELNFTFTYRLKSDQELRQLKSSLKEGS